MRFRFIIQKDKDGEWIDYPETSKEKLTNFIQAEKMLDKIMLKESGNFRIVSRRTQETIVKEYIDS